MVTLADSVLARLFDEDEREEFEILVYADMRVVIDNIARGRQKPLYWRLTEEELAGELGFELAKSMKRFLYGMPYEDWRRYTIRILVNRVNELESWHFRTTRKVEVGAQYFDDEEYYDHFVETSSFYVPVHFHLWEFMKGLSEDARKVVRTLLYPDKRADFLLKVHVADRRSKYRRDRPTKEGEGEGAGVTQIPPRVMAEILGISLERTRKAYKEIKERLTRREQEEITMAVGVQSKHWPPELPFGEQIITWKEVYEWRLEHEPEEEVAENGGNYVMWNKETMLVPQFIFRFGKQAYSPSMRKGTLMTMIADDDKENGRPPQPGIGPEEIKIDPDAIAKVLQAGGQQGDVDPSGEPAAVATPAPKMEESNKLVSGRVIKIGEDPTETEKEEEESQEAATPVPAPPIPKIERKPEPAAEETPKAEVVGEPIKVEAEKKEPESDGGPEEAEVPGDVEGAKLEDPDAMVTRLLSRLRAGETLLITRLSEYNWTVSLAQVEETAAAPVAPAVGTVVLDEKSEEYDKTVHTPEFIELRKEIQDEVDKIGKPAFVQMAVEKFGFSSSDKAGEHMNFMNALRVVTNRRLKAAGFERYNTKPVDYSKLANRKKLAGKE